MVTQELKQQGAFTMKTELCVVTLTLCLVAAGPTVARTWTDNTGKHSVEAHLVEVRQDKVLLRKADGSLLAVPVERLSDADRRYLESLSKPAAPDEQPARPSKPTRPPGGPRETPQPVRIGRAVIERALGRPAKCEFVELPLSDAIERVAVQHQIQFYIDRRALDDVGIPADVPVTAKGDQQSLENVLDAVLGPLDLTWMIRDDVLFITTKEEEEDSLEAKVYVFLRPVANVDAIIAQIEEAVVPRSWDHVGGPGSIKPWYGGTLVVAQASSVHRQLEQQFARMMRPIVSTDPQPTNPPARGPSKPLDALGQASTCQFTDTPLKDAVQVLAKQHGVAMVVDARALGDVGIPPDVPVTLRLRGVRLESALSLLLSALDLTWTIKDDVLVITTLREAQSELASVAYDVRDLQAAGGGDLGSLIGVILSTVAPASWDGVGGPGSIVPAGGALRIQQTLDVHRQIQQLLDHLRKARRR